MLRLVLLKHCPYIWVQRSTKRLSSNAFPSRVSAWTAWTFPAVIRVCRPGLLIPRGCPTTKHLDLLVLVTYVHMIVVPLVRTLFLIRSLLHELCSLDDVFPPSHIQPPIFSKG
jgi:hypothetical protein